MKWLQNSYKLCLENRAKCAMDFLRIYLGIGLFAKGLIFIIAPKVLSSWMQTGEILVLETLVSHYVVLAHICGGFLLMLGLLTRISAIFQLPILLGAVFFVHLQEGFLSPSQNLEFTILVSFLLVLITFTGSGPLSVDAYVFNESEKADQ